ncbi:MAG: Ig-like domain-containing protein [Pseudoflavonifractor sp.]
MKDHKYLRRYLPLLTLTALLMTMAVPASAFLLGGKDGEAVPTVAAFSKNGLATGTISFSPSDFTVSGGTLHSIIFSALPDPDAGILTLAGAPLRVGDAAALSAVAGLRFQPISAPAVGTTEFSFTPVFADGFSGDAVTVGIYLLAAKNNPPIAENLTLCTYKNVALTGHFIASDPEGDLLTFQLVEKPARGAVTMPEDGSDAFIYTPYENKTGKDSFTYVAVDAVGNPSAPATVALKISKAGTKVTYADMPGVPSYKAAIRLAEDGVFVGENIGGQYFFSPNAPISRSEFIAMTMKAIGLDALPDVTSTGFADDVTIPTWARAYAASALKSGVVLGAADPEGRIVFNAETTITRAEATVLLNRALRITDVSAETMLPGGEIAPVWAVQSAANLQTCGILHPDDTGAIGLSAPLNRGDAAQMILGAMEVLDARGGDGWWIF